MFLLKICMIPLNILKIEKIIPKIKVYKTNAQINYIYKNNLVIIEIELQRYGLEVTMSSI